MSSSGTAAPDAASERMCLTVEQVWRGVSGAEMRDGLLEWVPDVVAFTAVVLQRAQAFRFVVSPPPEQHWPPKESAAWGDEVHAAARDWCASLDDPCRPLPELVVASWNRLMQGRSASIEALGEGRPWGLCEALLTLHAIADESCAGICASPRPTTGPGVAFRARAREMLARAGTIARVPAERLSVLPKARTGTGGISHRSLSRYTCVETNGLRTVWHRAPIRQPGFDPGGQHANIMLLPWPMRIRETDFRPVEGSVRRVDREPFGFFHYSPGSSIDLELTDRLLGAALDEVDRVDAVVLPEAAVAEHELAGLEALLRRRKVPLFITGVRMAPASTGVFPGNSLHIGVFIAGRWWHYRQDKHHRWYLDADQIEQYRLGGAFHPRIRWWEAMDVPRRSVSVIELGEGVTLAAVICEDLARLDGVADLLRSIGPTLVVTVLLDGPQLASRWTARYAGVLADDPGSAVLTLTAYGMVRRSRPPDMEPSNVVAMWKDHKRGVRELGLEDGAHAVLVTAAVDRATRYAADGRAPADDGAELLLVGAQCVQADGVADGTSSAEDLAPELGLAAADLTVLAGWAEALAEAVAVDDACIASVLADLRPDARWRAGVGLSNPSGACTRALEALGSMLGFATDGAHDVALDTVLDGLPHSADVFDRLARRLLRPALESLRTP